MSRLLHFTEYGNKSGRTVVLAAGWPDVGNDVWKNQLAVLEKQQFRVVIINLPTFEPDEIWEKRRKTFPMFGYSVDQIAVMLRNTVDVIMCGRGSATADNGRPPLGVVHDWASITANAAVFNEYNKNDTGAASQPMFSRLVMIDVGTELNMFHAFPKMLLICFIYQGLAQLAWFIATFINMSVGDKLHRWTARTVSKAPDPDRTRAVSGSYYFRLWFGWRPAASFAGSRDNLKGGHHHSDFSRIPLLFVCANGYRDKCSFHTPRFEKFVRDENKGGSVWAVPTLNHWMYYTTGKQSDPRIGDHVDEFNCRMLEFFAKEKEDQS